MHAEALEADGVDVLTGHKALRCEKRGDAKFIVVEAGGAEQRIDFDVLLCAVGRSARLKGFGLEELGIPVKRTVQVNEYLRDELPEHPRRRRRRRPLPVHAHRRRTRPGTPASTRCSAPSRNSRPTTR